MFDILLRVALWFWKLWEKVPPETKEEIINAITDAFEGVFKEYYNKSRREEK
jgi:hypothetical protein